MPLRLTLKNLFKHKLRAILTAASLAVAMFLLCVLQSLVVSLDAGVRSAVSDRLLIQSAVSLYVDLPESYGPKLRSIEGVAEVSKLQWFGGIYQDASNFFSQFAVDPQEFVSIYSELEIIDGSTDRFLTERRGCLIGFQTAEKYGFEVGDTIPLIGQIFPRLDGSAWEMQVSGIYRSNSGSWDQSTLFFPYEYLAESFDQGAASGERAVGVYTCQLEETADPVAVAAEVDAMFENGPQRVQATSEAEFNAQFVSMIGNVPFFVSTIGSAVLAAIFLAVLNTMLMSGREQRKDVGVLKALGFSDGTVFGVLLTQGLVLCVVGGGAGIALAVASSGAFASVLGTRFPGYEVTVGVMSLAGGLSLAMGLVSGVIPAWQARRLTVIDALRREE